MYKLEECSGYKIKANMQDTLKFLDCNHYKRPKLEATFKTMENFSEIPVLTVIYYCITVMYYYMLSLCVVLMYSFHFLFFRKTQQWMKIGETC